MILNNSQTGSLIRYNGSNWTNTRDLTGLISVHAANLYGGWASEATNLPNTKIGGLADTINNTQLKHSTIETRNDLVVMLNKSSDTSYDRRFRVQNRNGVDVFSVDEAGVVKTGKIKDTTGNDKIEYLTNLIKLFHDLQIQSGKIKDGLGSDRIDFSNTTLTKIHGSVVQHVGASPATIKGPDADKFIVQSQDDLEFKSGEGVAAGVYKNFNFYHDNTLKYVIDWRGSIYYKTPGARVHDSNDNVLMQFNGDGNATITNVQTSNIISTGDINFQVDHDQDAGASVAGDHSFKFKNGAGTEIANLDESGNLQIDGDLTVSSGNITGNVSGTATALTAGNKTISGNLTVTGTTLELGFSDDHDCVMTWTNDNNQAQIGVSNDTNSLCIGDTDGDLVINSTGGGHNVLLATGNFPRFKVNSTGGCEVINDLTTGGDIELGHASDTTIARSSAGTVTIEGKEVVTINKMRDVHTVAYHHSTNNQGHYLTMSGATTNDSTFLSASSFHLMRVMPYDGRILKITCFNQSASSRDESFKLYIDGDDNPLTDNRGSELTFTSNQKGSADCPSDWTFSAGEAISIRRQCSTASQGTNVTIVFEFDMTT